MEHIPSNWPWQVTITYTDGTTRNSGHPAEDDVMEYARVWSQGRNVARVDVATSFVAGEQVTPTTTEV